MTRKSGYIGFYNDESAYLSGATTLASHGTYDDFSQPGETSMVTHTPGYPMILSLFVPLTHDRLQRLPWVTMAFAVGSIALLWATAGELGVQGTPRIILTLLYGLHPLFITYSTTLMTEMPYLFFSLLALLLSRKESLSRFWVGLLCGYLYLIRPIGLSLLTAFIAAELMRKSWKGAWLLICGSLICILPWTIRNLIHTGSPLTFLLQAEADVSGMNLLQKTSFALNLAMVNFRLYMENLVLLDLLPLFGFPHLQITAGDSPANRALFFSLIAVVVSVLIVLTGAVVTTARSKSLVRENIYAGFYLLILSGWHAVSERYFLPILPILLLIVGAAYAKRPAGPGRRFSVLALVILIAWLDLSADAQMLKAALLKNDPHPLPERTFSWIRRNIPPDNLVMSDKVLTLHTYTGHHGYQTLFEDNPDVFYSKTLDLKIKDVVVFHEDAARIYEMCLSPALTHRVKYFSYLLFLRDNTRYRKVYEDPQERMSVYHVLAKDPDTVRYALALENFGQAALENGDAPGAKFALEQALGLEPTLKQAQLETAHILITEKKELQARSVLEKALKEWPDNIAAAANYGRLLLRMGEFAEGKNYLETARVLSVSIGSADMEKGFSRELENLAKKRE